MQTKAIVKRTGEIDPELLVRFTGKVAALFGIAIENLNAPSRDKKIIHCRWMIWKFMRIQCNLSLVETGKIYYKEATDHTAVIYALKRIDQLIRIDDWYGKIWRKVTYKERKRVRLAIDYKGYDGQIAEKYYKKKIKAMNRVQPASLP